MSADRDPVLAFLGDDWRDESADFRYAVSRQVWRGWSRSIGRPDAPAGVTDEGRTDADRRALRSARHAMARGLSLTEAARLAAREVPR